MIDKILKEHNDYVKMKAEYLIPELYKNIVEDKDRKAHEKVFAIMYFGDKTQEEQIEVAKYFGLRKK